MASEPAHPAAYGYTRAHNAGNGYTNTNSCVHDSAGSGGRTSDSNRYAVSFNLSTSDAIISARAKAEIEGTVSKDTVPGLSDGVTTQSM